MLCFAIFFLFLACNFSSVFGFKIRRKDRCNILQIKVFVVFFNNALIVFKKYLQHIENQYVK